MTKSLLLLIASLPVIGLLYLNGVRLAGAALGGTFGTSAESLDGLKSKVKDRKAQAEQVKKKADDELANENRSYAEKLKRSRSFVRACELIEDGKSPDPIERQELVNEPRYYALLQQLEKLSGVYEDYAKWKSEYEAIPANRKDIKAKFYAKHNENRKAQFYSMRRFKNVDAHFAWIDLEEDHLNKAGDIEAEFIDKKTPNRARTVEKIRTCVDALKDFQKVYAGTDKVSEKADTIQKWMTWKALADIFEKEENEVTYPSKKALFADYEKLCEAGNSLAGSPRLHRGIRDRICINYLTESLPPDPIVLIVQSGITTREPRKIVEFERKGKPGTEKFKNYDEWSYPDDVDLIFCRDENGSLVRPARGVIKATPWSEAARAYNKCVEEIRQSTGWTRAAVLKLHKVCVEHKAAFEGTDALRDTWRKINDLHDAANTCPKIFVFLP